VQLRKKLSRNKLREFLAQLPPCLIGMEACGGAHYWAREIRKLGHEGRVIPPQYVKPYVKTHKNDYNDAEAICEAVSRPRMHFVPIKSVESQDLPALHRVREQLVKELHRSRESGARIALNSYAAPNSAAYPGRGRESLDLLESGSLCRAL
jgi:transposase